jgi:hypothetical protein
VWDPEAVRHIISGLMVPGHRCRGCPREVIVQHLSQRTVAGQADIDQSLVETGNGTAIHFVVLAVAAVHPDDGGLVTTGAGIRAGTTERLGPVSGKSLDMPGVEAVAEGMADHVIGHHATMPGVGKTAQAVVTTRCLKDCLHASILHASMMTMDPYQGNTMAESAQSDGNQAPVIDALGIAHTETSLGPIAKL